VVIGVVYFGNWTVSYISWKATSSSAADRPTVSQRSVEEGYRLQRHRKRVSAGGATQPE
jgi:hypothetical protein